jgi:hypothetical protein
MVKSILGVDGFREKRRGDYRPWSRAADRGTLSVVGGRNPKGGEVPVTIRCVLDGLLLYATLRSDPPTLLAFDGDESFTLEAVEALYYELVAATREELLGLERACYRLLRRAADFRHVEDSDVAPG